MNATGWNDSTAAPGASCVSTSDMNSAMKVLVFGILVILTNGSLLGVLFFDSKTRKNMSLVTACNCVTVLVWAMVDSTFRVSVLILTEHQLSNLSIDLCALMVRLPDFFNIVVLLLVPLMAVERLVKIFRPFMHAQTLRNLFSALVASAFVVTAIITGLPSTKVFQKEAGLSRCSYRLHYGISYPLLYIGLACAAVVSTALILAFTICCAKKRLEMAQVSQRLKLHIRLGIKTTIIVTAVLIVSTIPYGLTIQLVYGCGGKLVNSSYICRILPEGSQVFSFVQKAGFVILPLTFIYLNPVLRRRIQIRIKTCIRKEVAIHSLSSTQTQSSQSTSDMVIDEDYEQTVICRDDTLKYRYRHRFINCVDILSIISETTEKSSTWASVKSKNSCQLSMTCNYISTSGDTDKYARKRCNTI